MKIGHDKIDRENKGKNNDYCTVPIKGEVALQGIREGFLKNNRETHQCSNQTKGKVFIREMKEVLEGKIKQEMHRCPEQPRRKRIEVRYLGTFFYALTNV